MHVYFSTLVCCIVLTIVDHLCLVISLAYSFFDSFEQWFNAVCKYHNITHRKVQKFGLGFNGIAKMLRFLLVVINSDYSIEVLLSSNLDHNLFHDDIPLQTSHCPQLVAEVGHTQKAVYLPWK